MKRALLITLLTVGLAFGSACRDNANRNNPNRNPGSPTINQPVNTDQTGNFLSPGRY